MNKLLWSLLALHLASDPCAQTQFELISTPAVSFPLTDAVARDFDGDGDVDIFGLVGLVALPVGSVLLRNDGRGRFVDVTASSLQPVAAVSPATALAAFDMDGDADVDVFVCEQAGARLWRNSGNGVFTDVSGNLPVPSNALTAVVAADFDGDGDVDLAVGGFFLNGSQNKLFVNDGSGVFTASSPFPGSATLSMATADIDGDADVDLVLGELSGPRLWRNDGGLVFTDVTAASLPVLQGSNTQSVAFGDLDGDDDQDLVVANSSGNIDYVLRNTAGAFTTIASLTSGFAGTSSMALVDVDEDGDLDLLRARIFSTVALALNDGAGGFVDAAARLPAVGVFSSTIVVADIEGDGDPDLLACDTFAPFAIVRNRHRHLESGLAALGQTWMVTVWSAPGYATLHHTSRLGIALTRLPQPLQVPGFGALWLDLDAGYVLVNAIVFAVNGQHQYGFPVPSLPALVGLELHVQAVIEQARAPARFTGYDTVVVQ